jgi:hypothetical protein
MNSSDINTPNNIIIYIYKHVVPVFYAVSNIGTT